MSCVTTNVALLLVSFVVLSLKPDRRNISDAIDRNRLDSLSQRVCHLSHSFGQGHWYAAEQSFSRRLYTLRGASSSVRPAGYLSDVCHGLRPSRVVAQRDLDLIVIEHSCCSALPLRRTSCGARQSYCIMVHCCNPLYCNNKCAWRRLVSCVPTKLTYISHNSRCCNHDLVTRRGCAVHASVSSSDVRGTKVSLGTFRRTPSTQPAPDSTMLSTGQRKQAPVSACK